MKCERARARQHSARLVGAAACAFVAAPAQAGPPGDRRAAPQDKAALFGDARLVPTREGEQARREIASAGELGALLGKAGYPHARVSVTGRGAQARVAVVFAPGLTDGAQAQATARTLAAQVLDPQASVRVVLPNGQAPAAPAGRPSTDPLLWLALLGLGVSGGISFDRRRRLPRS